MLTNENIARINGLLSDHHRYDGNNLAKRYRINRSKMGIFLTVLRDLGVNIPDKRRAMARFRTRNSDESADFPAE